MNPLYACERMKARNRPLLMGGLLAPGFFGDRHSSLVLVGFVLARLVNCNALRDTIVVAAPGDDGVVGEVEHALDGFAGVVSNCNGQWSDLLTES
jgi:hypothetical protein